MNKEKLKKLFEKYKLYSISENKDITELGYGIFEKVNEINDDSLATEIKIYDDELIMERFYLLIEWISEILIKKYKWIHSIYTYGKENEYIVIDTNFDYTLNEINNLYDIIYNSNKEISKEEYFKLKKKIYDTIENLNKIKSEIEEVYNFIDNTLNQFYNDIEKNSSK